MRKKNDSETMRQLINGFKVTPERNIKEHNCVLPYGYLTVSNTNPVTLNENINEGLIQTYPIDTTIRYIKEFFNLNDWDIKKVTLANNIEGIHIIVGDVGNNRKVVTRAMSSCGYHFSRIYDEYFDHHNGVNYLTLEYLPKFQEDDISEEVRKNEPCLYHITPSCYEGKIKKIGLTPKTKNPLNDYPDRIYLLRGSAGEEYIRSLGAALFNANQNKPNRDKYTVFVLDTEKVCDKVKLFEDPQSSRGLWTYHNIPPDSITGIKHIEFDKNNNLILN